VNVLDESDMGGIFKYIWKRMTTALMAGNFAGALSDHAEASRDRYSATFEKYTVDQLNANLSTVVDVLPSSLYENVAECGVIREEEDGEKYAYPVTYVKDANGVWKILEY
jgi:hypothetical protein